MNSSITVNVEGGEIEAFVDTWLGPRSVPVYFERGFVGPLDDFDYDCYSFEDRLVII